MSEERTTVFIIDDDPSARRGLLRLIQVTWDHASWDTPPFYEERIQ